MLKFDVTASILFVVITATGMGAAQPSGQFQQDRSPNHPVNTASTDAEILSALDGKDHGLTELQLKRALHVAAGTLQTATVRAISAELVRVETDVRATFMRDPESVNEGNNNFEYAVALLDVLAAQMNPAGIPGLIEVVDFGPPPQRALVAFGEAAAPALAELAVNGRSGSDSLPAAAMSTLAQMLNDADRRETLSPNSLQQIRRAAAQRLANTRGSDNYAMLSAAAELAVATGDPALRQQVENLVDNSSEFVRRGMNVDAQQDVSEAARKALQQSAAPK